MSNLALENLILPFAFSPSIQMSLTKDDQHSLQCEVLRGSLISKLAEVRLKEDGLKKELIYPNQQEAAVAIQTAFSVENKICVTLIALPGAGKTGTFLATAYNMCVMPTEGLTINYNNVVILTGMNDVDWQVQTKAAMISSFATHVYHRGQFNRVREILQTATIRDVLIIIDECHIGANQKHTLSTMLVDLGILDIEFLRRRNIRILEVSATPGHTLHDSKKWGAQNHSLIMLKPSDCYVGFKKFKEEGRLRTSLALEKPQEVEKLCKIIEDRWATMPRWHPIRMGRKSSKILENITTSAKKRGWDIINHNSDDRIKDIDTKMKAAPQNHTFILIKDFWRAAKRLRYKFVGIVHEPETTNPDASVQAQALAARLCDNYTEEYDINTAPLIFCTVESIDQYLAWYENGGNYSDIDYHSANLKANKINGTVIARESFSSPSNVIGLEKVVQDEQQQAAATLASKVKGLSIPKIIQLTQEEYATIPGGQNFEGKKKAIITLVEAKDPSLAANLRNFKCKQITKPDEDISYKTNIESLVDKSNKSKVCGWWGLNKTEDKLGKVWACFIDQRKYRLCFNVIGDRS